MKEKAKTEARNIAKGIEDEAHKLGVLLKGKAYLYPECTMFENIQYLAWAIGDKKHLIKKGQHTEKDLKESFDAAAKWAQDSLLLAVRDNDVGFFERMADLARIKKAGQTIDEKAAKVSIALKVFRLEKKAITGEAIAEYLNWRWPKASQRTVYVKGDKTPIIEGREWDGGEVRKICSKIGESLSGH
jgi:hypothetical protein